MPNETDDTHPAANRAAKRDSLFLLTDFFDVDGQLIGAARVRNLSATGLMAECDRALAEGDKLRLTLRGAGELGATVSWARDGKVGLLFDQEIDPIAARRPIKAGAVNPSIVPAPSFAATRFSRPPR